MPFGNIPQNYLNLNGTSMIVIFIYIEGFESNFINTDIKLIG